MEELTLHRLEVLFIITPIMLPVVFQLLEYEMRCRGSGVRGGIGEEELFFLVARIGVLVSWRRRRS